MAATTADLLEAAKPESVIEDAPESKVSRLFSPRGRIGVRTYLARTLLGCLPIGAVGLLAAFTVNAGPAGNADGGLGPVETGVMILAAAVTLVSVFYMLIMGIRRLHDLEMHGWFYLVTMVPFVGGFFSLYMMFAPGKTERNKYGAFLEPSMFDTVVGGFLLGLLGLGVIGLGVASLYGLASSLGFA